MFKQMDLAYIKKVVELTRGIKTGSSLPLGSAEGSCSTPASRFLLLLLSLSSFPCNRLLSGHIKQTNTFLTQVVFVRSVHRERHKTRTVPPEEIGSSGCLPCLVTELLYREVTGTQVSDRLKLREVQRGTLDCTQAIDKKQNVSRDLSVLFFSLLTSNSCGSFQIPVNVFHSV